MKKAKILIYAVCCLFLVACDDFLDEKPRHNLTLENSVTDYDGAKNILNGIYAVIGNERSLGGEIFIYLAVQAGLYDYYSYDYDYYNMTYLSETVEKSDPWLSLYKVVNAANAAVQAMTDLDVAKYPSPETKETMIGEARGLRAWAYAQLLWYYSHWWEEDDCPYGILYRDRMADLNNLQLARKNVGESYRLIFEDIDYATDHLAGFTSSRYLSKQMMQVLKAKMLLYRGAMRNNEQELREALELVIEVKTTAPAVWAMESDLTELYEKGWDSKEVLWARYIGDWSPMRYGESYYSNYMWEASFNDRGLGWLKEDGRYHAVWGMAVDPYAYGWTEEMMPVKLYHKGAKADPDAPYTAYYFRYAELYLMEAELKARLNEYAVRDALVPLNEMRAQRIHPVLSPLTAATKEEVLQKIFREIWAEQFLENGSEYFAALRFINDDPDSSAPGKPWIYTLKPDVDITEDRYCWPIPKDETQANHLIIQNQGFDR